LKPREREAAALKLRNLIDIEDLTLEEWNELYGLASQIIAHPKEFTDALHGNVMASLFYEPSTRTNFSFQAAMLRLGGQVFGFADPKSSSAAKGETLKDTIKMVSGYADIIVMRNPKEGAAKAASLYADVPVVNAGDGGHMHPTQTLADLTTIATLRGGIENLNVGLCGDLKYGRTVHSLIKALAKFPGIRFYLIAPRDLAVPGYMLDFLKANQLPFVEVTSLEATMPQLDVLYMTRIQRERFTDPLEYDRLKGVYVLTRSKLQNAKKDLLIMHPLPRVDEIHQNVDDDPRAVYFDQARYGMYARMALLMKLSEQGRRKADPQPLGTAPVCHNQNCITQTELYLPPLTKQVGGKCCCGYCDKEI
jgi:aspartate carbamoyltransferase catalytic subunit